MTRIFLQISLFRSEGEQEVSGHLKAEPTACHAWSNLEQIGNNALVHAFDPFLRYDDSNGIKNRLVLVPHSGHSVDLETAAKNITGFFVSQDITRKMYRIGTYKGYVQVCATAPEIAPAASFLIAFGFLSPSGVRYFLTIS